MSDNLIDDPVGRQRLKFEHCEDDDGAPVLIVDVWVDPGGGVPPHIHPRQEERFLVLEGEVTFTAGREKVRAPAGKTVLVPPGTRHAYRNAGDATAHMRCRARPPRDLEEFLTETAALGRQGHIARLGPLRGPKRPSSVPLLADFLRRHREDTVILMPPPFVQRLAMDPLARFAKPRAGIEPGAG